MGVSFRATARPEEAGQTAVNWFQRNRALGTSLIALGVTTIAVMWFLVSARSAWDEAAARFETDATELARLQRLTPFPSGDNLRKMKAHVEDYGTAVARLKEELKLHVLPVAPLAPSEFQSRLRVAIGAVAERARASKVKLPNNFFLGFDEFASGLPETEAAPLLGQELAQVEALAHILISARVDAITALRRTSRSDVRATPTPGPTTRKPTAPAAAQLVARNAVDVSFTASPAAARRVLNQVAATEKQFYIVRLLQVRNEKDKGPPREPGTETSGGASSSTQSAAKPPGTAALKFIVGTEHIETSARIELVRFTFDR
jgi:hypothetical protein